MSLKLKLVLGLLFVVAVFTVYRSVGFIKPGSLTGNIASQFDGQSNSAETASGRVQIPPSSKDADADGLNDSEESLYDADPFRADTDEDGYLDGEEVLSGYNPAEKDKKQEQAQKNTQNNLTAKYVNSLLNMLASGGSEEDIPAVLPLTVLDGIENNLASTPPEPLVERQSSPASQREYLVAAARLMNFVPSQDKYATKGNPVAWATMAHFFKKIGAELNTMIVPKEFVAWHQKTVATLARGVALYEGLAQMESDPLLSMSVLEIMPDILTDLSLARNDLNKLLRDHQINVFVRPYVEIEKNTTLP